MEVIVDLIEPQFAALVAALYCLGVALKRTEHVQNCYIPLLLTACGLALAVLSALGHRAEYANLWAALFEAAVQGILCAGMSVYINQLAKQSQANK